MRRASTPTAPAARCWSGDSLGLAQPLTAEGILPAIVSGRLAAEAILAGDPASYPARMHAHPVIADYRRIARLRRAIAGLGVGARGTNGGTPQRAGARRRVCARTRLGSGGACW